MTIWILTVLLLAAVAFVGSRQGGIRAAASFLGIAIGGFLAVPLGHLIRPLFGLVGIKNPFLVWSLPPVIMFAVVLTLFKIAGFVTHTKVEVYYKYKAGDLRLALWERINLRLGLCVGVLNGAAYLVLISVIIYMASYWTYQTSSANEPRKLQFVNRLGKDLEWTGLAKVAHAVDQTPATFYDTADIAGLIYQTPLLDARLSRYPAFLGIGERPELQAIGGDKNFAEMRLSKKPITVLLADPQVKGALKNPALVKAVKDALVPNLQDLRTFLETGRSPKFDSERLLGRWDFDVNGAIALIRHSRPNLPSSQMAQIKAALSAGYGRTGFIATPEQQAYLKNIPSRTAPGQTQTVQGEWKKADNKYELTFNVDGKNEQLTGEFQGNRLTLTGAGMDLAFSREN